MPPAPASTGPRVVYGIDDRPPLAEAVPLGIQHVVAMLLGNITTPILVAGALGLAVADEAFLIQMVLLMAGLSTVVQSYPVGPVGGRVPVVMGTSIAFLGAIIGIGREWGLAVVFGACLAASVVETGLGFAIVRVRRLFPPLVNSIVVMLIGLTLIPVGMDYAAGGRGAGDYGSPRNLSVAALVFLVTLGLNQFGRGFLAYGSMLAGVVVGYAAAVPLGMVDFSAVAEAGWFALPRWAPYGLEFEWLPIALMGFIYVISTMETIGDISGTLAAVGREPTARELRGGLVADGVMSGLAALVSAFPNTSYSQNVGLVNFTGVVSRHVTAVGGIFLLALGLIPKVGALFATIPAPVIGGGGLIMFAMIFSSGAAIFHRGVRLSRRNLVILAVALALGLGVELRPEVLARLPEWARTLFGSGLIAGGLTALALNLLLPRRRRPPLPTPTPEEKPMLKSILSVVVGYLVMAVVVMITMSLLWAVAGSDFAYYEGTTRATTAWSVIGLLLSCVAAVAGGYVARTIAPTPTAVRVLAGIILALGLVMAVAHLSVDDPTGTEALAERSIDELSMFEASAETVAPAWYNFFIPLVGAAGVIYGGRLRQAGTDGG